MLRTRPLIKEPYYEPFQLRSDCPLDTFSLLFFFVVWCCTAANQLPGTGARSAGSPIDSTVGLTFTIALDAAGDFVLWTESQPSVTISDGKLQVLLGAVNPISARVFDGGRRFLRVQMDGEPALGGFTPIVSVGYAYRSVYADSYCGGAQRCRLNRCQWTLADSVLYSNSYWGIARGHAGNILYGDSAHTMVNLGTNSFAGQQGQSYGYITISGGDKNAAQLSWNSTVGGGDQNTANSNYSTIAGGQRNLVGSMYGSVTGGLGDTVSPLYGGALSGRRNVAGDGSDDTGLSGGSGKQSTGLLLDGGWRARLMRLSKDIGAPSAAVSETLTVRSAALVTISTGGGNTEQQGSRHCGSSGCGRRGLQRGFHQVVLSVVVEATKPPDMLMS